MNGLGRKGIAACSRGATPVALLLAGMLAYSGIHAAADEIFSFGLDVTGDISTGSLNFGMDTDASDGFDTPTTYLLDIEAPPEPPGDSNNIYFSNPASTPSNLAQDIRGGSAAATWILHVDLDTEVDAVPGLAATVAWNIPADAFWDDRGLVLDLGGGQQVNMLSEESVILTASTDAYIRLFTVPEPQPLLCCCAVLLVSLLCRRHRRRACSTSA